MKFHCTVRRENDQWVVRHEGPQAGAVQVRAASRDDALEKMRGELRYRLELCPCTGETYQHIDIEVLEG
jgi:hypothetical protein